MTELTEAALTSAAAASKINEGWAKGAYEDSHGNMCMIQSVVRASGSSDHRTLTLEQAQRIEEQIGHYRCYRFGKWKSKSNTELGRIREAIVFFNDAPWRKKETVVAAMDGITVKYQKLALDALTIQLAETKERLAASELKVAALTAENRHLRKRLMNYLTGSTIQVRKEMSVTVAEFDRIESELQSIIALDSKIGV